MLATEAKSNALAFKCCDIVLGQLTRFGGLVHDTAAMFET